MADKRCKNGHFIDESWDICPYCPPAKGASADAPRRWIALVAHHPSPPRKGDRIASLVIAARRRGEAVEPQDARDERPQRDVLAVGDVVGPAGER